MENIHPILPLDRQDFDEFLRRMLRLSQQQNDMPPEDTPLGQITREFFANNWSVCRDGLLQRTTNVRLLPEPSPAPHRFDFEINCPYKRKRGPDQPVEVAPGPVAGKIIYRGDLFEDPDGGPTIAVLIDPGLGYFHANYCPHRGILCLGDQRMLPPGPIPLDRFIEFVLYPIVSYQNRRPSHPLDINAARYFALEPGAMEGLEPVEPLY